jgi:hypothetical protein
MTTLDPGSPETATRVLQSALEQYRRDADGDALAAAVELYLRRA